MQRAVITGARKPLAVISDTIPAVPTEGAVVKTQFAGICHSDLHFIEDEIDLGNGRVFRQSDVLGAGYCNLTPGHEISGVVMALGKGVDLEGCDLHPGDHVCVYPWMGCQECSNCLLGYNNLCVNNRGGIHDLGQGTQGGFATHVAVPHIRFLFKIPESVPMSLACMLCCSALTAYNALLAAKDSLDLAVKSRGTADLLVIGAGGVGLWCLQLALRGVFPDDVVKVTVADVTDSKVALAKHYGAHRGVLWSTKESQAAMIKQTTDSGKRKMDAVVNLVGSATTTEVAVGVLQNGGTVVLIGLYGGSVSLSLPIVIGRNFRLQGVRTGPVFHMKDIIKIVETGALKSPATEHYSLSDVNAAIDKLRKGEVAGRALIKF